MHISGKQKTALFCDVIQADFEKKIVKILNKESDFEEYDKKLDPLIRNYFKKLSEIESYFYDGDDEDEEISEEEFEEFIKQQKLALTITLCDRRFEESVSDDILSDKPLKEIDKIVIPKFNKYLEEKRIIKKYFYEYYGLNSSDE